MAGLCEGDSPRVETEPIVDVRLIRSVRDSVAMEGQLYASLPPPMRPAVQPAVEARGRPDLAIVDAPDEHVRERADQQLRALETHELDLETLDLPLERVDALAVPAHPLRLEATPMSPVGGRLRDRAPEVDASQSGALVLAFASAGLLVASIAIVLGLGLLILAGAILSA